MKADMIITLMGKNIEDLKSRVLERYTPISDYKSKVGLSNDTVPILAYSQKGYEPNDQQNIEHFILDGSNLIPISHDDFISLRNDTLESNMCLYNDNRDISTIPLYRFIEV